MVDNTQESLSPITSYNHEHPMLPHAIEGPKETESNEHKDIEHGTSALKRAEADLDRSSSIEEDKHRRSETALATKDRFGHVARIISTTSNVEFKSGARYDSACARCALSRISSTLLLEGKIFGRMSTRHCGRFPQHFKYALLAEIRKCQRVGLKSIEITNVSVDKKHNLIIEFDIIVDPQYNELIRNALRRAAITLDLKRIFKHQHHY